MINTHMKTAKGNIINPFNFKLSNVDIEDIAISLSNKCRFNGHCATFYSVAEHSVLVSRRLTPELELAGLLHDAAEAYFGDIITPIKKYVYVPDDEDFVAPIKKFEEKIAAVIFARFGVTVPFDDPDVKRVDDKMCQYEDVHIRFSPLPCWSPAQAKEEFLSRFHQLYNGK